MQYIFAILILRTRWGFDMFQWSGDRVSEFLDYTMAGILFAFGETWADHLFATKVCCLIKSPSYLSLALTNKGVKPVMQIITTVAKTNT